MSKKQQKKKIDLEEPPPPKFMKQETENEDEEVEEYEQENFEEDKDEEQADEQQDDEEQEEEDQISQTPQQQSQVTQKSKQSSLKSQPKSQALLSQQQSQKTIKSDQQSTKKQETAGVIDNQDEVQSKMEESASISKKSNNFEKNLIKASQIAEKRISRPSSSGSQIKPTQKAPKIEKSLVRKPSINYAPIANYKQFMPATSQTIIQSHAEADILKLIKEDDFEDPDFVGDENSLFGRDWEALNEQQKEERSDFIKEIKEKINWVEMIETVEESSKLQFCDRSDGDNFYVKSIVQGYLKDREFLNALALVCSNKQLFDYLACTDLNKSEYCYAFRFYKNKYSRYSVVVDTKIPTLSISSTVPTPCFSRTEIPNETWVSMIEKAYAKLNGGYAKIAGISLRDAIQDLCGLEPEIIVLEGLNQNNFYQYLKMSQANGSIIGFMLRQDVQVKNTSKEKNKLDALPEMNRVYVFQGIKNQDYIIKDPWFQGKELINGQKGTVSIDYNSLINSFNCMVVIKDFPDEWRGVKIDINMTSSNGIPSSTNLAWVQNFQYMIQVGVGVPGDMKEVPFHVRLNEIKGVQPQKEFVAGFGIFKAGDKEDKIKTFNQNNVLYLTKPGGSLCFGERIRDNYSYTIQKFEKKFYSLVPFTNQKGLTTGTYLQFEIFYAGRPSQLAFRFKGDQVMQYAVGESEELSLRILRDKLKQSDLSQFQFNHKNADLALVPGMCKYLILNNPNAAINTIKSQEVTVLDPKLQYIQENLFQEQILGLNDYSESDPKIVDQVVSLIEGIYDFSDYQFGDQYSISIQQIYSRGFQSILPTIISETKILQLNLGGNKLSDQSITQLCYELEKSYHSELMSLDLENNQISNKGVSTLTEFAKRMKNVQNINLDQNPNISQNQIEALQILLEKRRN